MKDLASIIKANNPDTPNREKTDHHLTRSRDQAALAVHYGEPKYQGILRAAVTMLTAVKQFVKNR